MRMWLSLQEIKFSCENFLLF